MEFVTQSAGRPHTRPAVIAAAKLHALSFLSLQRNHLQCQLPSLGKCSKLRHEPCVTNQCAEELFLVLSSASRNGVRYHAHSALRSTTMLCKGCLAWLAGIDVRPVLWGGLSSCCVLLSDLCAPNNQGGGGGMLSWTLFGHLLSRRGGGGWSDRSR